MHEYKDLQDISFLAKELGKVQSQAVMAICMIPVMVSIHGMDAWQHTREKKFYSEITKKQRELLELFHAVPKE